MLKSAMNLVVEALDEGSLYSSFMSSNSGHEDDIQYLMAKYAPIDELTVLYVFQQRAHCELAKAC